MNNIFLNREYSTTQNIAAVKPNIKIDEKDKFETTLFLPKNKERSGEGGLRLQGKFKKNLVDKPLISIVTVVYNGVAHLEETILSVLNQSYDNIEYIVIDGGSTDGTVELIKKYESKIDYWVSEKDKGIYDAINKGISLTTGKWIGTINSDDYYQENIIASIINSNIHASVLYGNIALLDEKRQDFRVSKPKQLNTLRKEMCVFHPSTFISRNVYLKFGLYDSNLKLASDYKLFLNLYLKGVDFLYIDKTIAAYDVRGATGNNIIKSWLEVRSIQKTFGFSFYKYNLNFLMLCIKRFLLNIYQYITSKGNQDN